MGCDFPLKAYRTPEINPATGRHYITFNPLKAMNSTSPMEIPCNNCMGCKLERSRQWAVRMQHESKLYEENCFLTLTYSNEAIPSDYSLDLRHVQLFIKKLRKSLQPKLIRFYACGEYGPDKGRPHYHLIIFNHQFPDKKFFKMINQKPHYTSQLLTNLWSHGFATTADFSFQAAAYVARYVTKKIKNNDEYGANYYYRLSPIDGQYHFVKPEFSVMSRRPGIGHKYVEKYKSDFYPSGFVVVDGIKHSPPHYYVSKLSEEEQQHLKRAARRKALVYKPHQTTERRLARAAVRDARIQRLKRDFDK